MAEKRRFLDVWIVENQTVYREVPFMVVTDWIQQGRLLADDQVRPSGTRDWYRIGESPTFAPYMPKVEEHRAEDQAEALEPVQIDFTWKRRPEDEDEDVDMIPLIDVSLVLLIFFMMTTTVAGAGSLIKTPFAGQGARLTSEDRYWIGIERSADGNIVYSLGKGEGGAAEGERQLTEPQAIGKLEAHLRSGRPVNVHIRGGREVPYKYIKRMTIALEGFRDRGLIRKILTDVTTKENA
jgi:biopolymer transport protein ExbD